MLLCISGENDVITPTYLSAWACYRCYAFLSVFEDISGHPHIGILRSLIQTPVTSLHPLRVLFHSIQATEPLSSSESFCQWISTSLSLSWSAEQMLPPHLTDSSAGISKSTHSRAFLAHFSYYLCWLSCEISRSISSWSIPASRPGLEGRASRALTYSLWISAELSHVLSNCNSPPIIVIWKTLPSF